MKKIGKIGWILLGIGFCIMLYLIYMKCNSGFIEDPTVFIKENKNVLVTAIISWITGTILVSR